MIINWQQERADIKEILRLQIEYQKSIQQYKLANLFENELKRMIKEKDIPGRIKKK